MQNKQQNEWTSASIDIEQAYQFLELLDPEAAAFTIQTFDDNKARKSGVLARIFNEPLCELIDKLVDLQKRGAGVFAAINETDLSGRKKHNVRRLRGIWQDDDEGWKGTFPLEPTMVTESSPGKFQRFWLLAKGEELSEHEHANILNHLVDYFGSDNGAKGINRVMRLPGFLHQKGKPFQTRIVAASGKRYTSEELLTAFPPTNRKGSDKNSGNAHKQYRNVKPSNEEIAEAMTHIPADERQNWLEVGMALHDFFQGDMNGYTLWREWSALVPNKYDDGDQNGTWKSFENSGITIRSVFALAEKHGCNLSNLAKKYCKGKEGTDTSGQSSLKLSEPDMSVLTPIASPSPAIDLSGFPSKARQWIEARAELANCSIDYVAASWLIAAATLIGTARKICPWEGWVQPAILRGVIIGAPSSNKTPSLTPVQRLLSRLESMKQKDWKTKYQKWEIENENAEQSIKDWKADLKEHKKARRATPPAPNPAPIEPPRPRLWTSDSSTEELGVILSGNPKGICLFVDELAGLIGSHDRYSGQGTDRAFQLSTYDGNPYSIDRKSNPDPILIESAALSIFGGIQPDKLQMLLGGDNDGYAARFLLFAPGPVPARRPDPETCADDDTMMIAFERLDALVCEDDLVAIPLSSDAASLFEEWWITHKTRAQTMLGLEGAFHGKMEGQALRIALVLTLVLWAFKPTGTPEPQEIDTATIHAAIKLLEKYFKPTLENILNGIGHNKSEQAARLLAKDIVKRKCKIVNAREITHDWKVQGLKTADQVRQAINFLEDGDIGWLRFFDTRPGQSGRKKKSYSVNPKVHTITQAK